VAAVVVATGARALARARALNPVRVPSAFGTLATTEDGAAVLRELRDTIAPEGGEPPPLFAYPSDAWLYLALPADNPTPFCLMMVRYNTPQQFDEAIARLRSDPNALVFVRWGLLRPGDPVLSMLRQEYEMVRGFGPPHPANGMQGLMLYARRGRSAGE
jgi:hypothetical protein